MLKVVKSNKVNVLSKHHFTTSALWDKCEVKEFDVSSVVKSSRSILSSFKKPVNTVNNDADIPESFCIVVNSDVNSKNVLSPSKRFSLPERPYHTLKDFVFPKIKFVSRNPRSCQHN